MMKIGIAGGIGSGKSYVCARIRQRGFEVYDCDSAAKRLIRTDPDIRRQLTALIGPDAYTPEGQLNKAVVARFLLASDANSAAIDAIVHPAVFRDFEASGLQWLESAIMYESGSTQVLAWMGKQLPQEEVVARADFELVNDGEADIEQQLNNIIEQCNKPF